jgi:hypothetical protein
MERRRSLAMCRFVRVIVSIVAVACIAAMLFACRKTRLEACDPADSKAICAAVQECFESSPSAVCREHERWAIQMSKPNPMLGPNGAAKALTY